MITLHDLLDNFCCIDPYTDYAIVNIETGEVLVDRVHDRTSRLMMLMITQSSYLMHASRFERGKQKMGK